MKTTEVGAGRLEGVWWQPGEGVRPKSRAGIAAAVWTTALLLAGAVFATPSTCYWTPATADVQPYGVVHVGVDNYFTVRTKAASGAQDAFPTDVGVTVGVLPFEQIQMEVGVDALFPSDDPFYVNAKLGIVEGALFEGSPALNVGIFNVGFKKDVTDFNVADLIVGKTLPWDVGRLHAGVYAGNRRLLASSEGEDQAKGWMVGFDRVLIKDRLSIGADYASGRNALGGGGAGLYYWFSPAVSLLVGPVWFNDPGVNGAMKWTVQFDANL